MSNKLIEVKNKRIKLTEIIVTKLNSILVKIKWCDL